MTKIERFFLALQGRSENDLCKEEDIVRIMKMPMEAQKPTRMTKILDALGEPETTSKNQEMQQT
jgi:hypothetical protein